MNVIVGPNICKGFDNELNDTIMNKLNEQETKLNDLDETLKVIMFKINNLFNFIPDNLNSLKDNSKKIIVNTNQNFFIFKELLIGFKRCIELLRYLPEVRVNPSLNQQTDQYLRSYDNNINRFVIGEEET